MSERPPENQGENGKPLFGPPTLDQHLKTLEDRIAVLEIQAADPRLVQMRIVALNASIDSRHDIIAELQRQNYRTHLELKQLIGYVGPTRQQMREE